MELLHSPATPLTRGRGPQEGCPLGVVGPVTRNILVFLELKHIMRAVYAKGDCLTESPNLYSTASSIRELLTMHRPNFCSACGVKIIRLHWRLWTSRRFCDGCSQRLRKERLTLPLILASALFCIGLVAGRSGRPAPHQLIIERSANSPLYPSQSPSQNTTAPGRENGAVNEAVGSKSETSLVSQPQAETAAEVIYICGARTKKGTPCSRRVHVPGRCWQHKGMPAMLPAEKLILQG